jgi:hypothetical protein
LKIPFGKFSVEHNLRAADSKMKKKKNQLRIIMTNLIKGEDQARMEQNVFIKIVCLLPGTRLGMSNCEMMGIRERTAFAMFLNRIIFYNLFLKTP